MTSTKRISHPDLLQYFRAVFNAVDVPPHVAEIEAEIGAEVDLCGVHSHGAQLLPMVVKAIQDGITNPDPKFEIIEERAATVLADTRCGIGRYVSAIGMDMAVDRAEEYGIGAVAIRGVAHWGRGHSYALRAARDGMIGIAFTNTLSNFPAWGTGEPTLGNNPMAIGVPAGDQDPVVLDIAMTQTAIGTIMSKAAAGERVPFGWGLDEEGNPTDEPNAILKSRRFQPMGEHKGSGLSFMIELLTAGLANGLLCQEQGKGGHPTDSLGGSTKLFIAIRPFGDWLGSRVESLKNHLKSASPFPDQGEAKWPGEGSFRRRQDFEENGIALPDTLASELDELAGELSIQINWQTCGEGQFVS